MLALLAIVMCGSVLVIGRLSSGASVDLTKLSMSVLKLQDDPSHTMSDQTEDHSQNDLLSDSKKTVSDPSVPQITAIPRPAAGSFTLTLG